MRLFRRTGSSALAALAAGGVAVVGRRGSMGWRADAGADCAPGDVGQSVGRSINYQNKSNN